MSKPPILVQADRQVLHYDFEGGSYVSVLVSGEVPTADVMDVLEELIGRKREELARLKVKPAGEEVGDGA